MHGRALPDSNEKPAGFRVIFEKLWQLLHSQSVTPEEIAHVITEVALFLERKGEFPQSELSYLRARAMCKAICDPGHDTLKEIDVSLSGFYSRKAALCI